MWLKNNGKNGESFYGYLIEKGNLELRKIRDYFLYRWIFLTRIFLKIFENMIFRAKLLKQISNA